MSALSPGGQCILSPPLSQPLSFLGVLREHRLRCGLCLLWGADLWLRPSWRMSTIQDPRKTWFATGILLSLVEDAVSGAEIALRLPALAVACLPLVGVGLVCSWLALLWYLINPLFCEQAWIRYLCLRLELFTGKFSLSIFFFFPSLWLSHSLGCSSTLAPSDCPQGIQAQSLP